jgi:serine phosphatase RsbU (regulator of sigma subunit)
VSRFLLTRDVQPFLEVLAQAVGGAVLLDPGGELIWQAGAHEKATAELPVVCGDLRGTLAIPPEGARLGALAVSALERMATARATIDDLASKTRRLWWEQNLLFYAGELLRRGFADRDIARWLVDRLAVMEPQTVVILNWDGKSLEVAEGKLPDGLRVGDRLAASTLAAQVLDRGEALAFATTTEESLESELRVPVQPNQPCLLVPLRSAERVLGVVLVLRRVGDPMFTAEQLKLVQLLSDLASVALTNRILVQEAEHTARMVRELEIAAEIQRRLFPPPIARYGSLEVAARCEPVTQVGGDGFLQRRLRHGGVALGVVDLTGHGIGVSLALSALFARLDALADAVETPGELLTLVNDQLTQGEFNSFTMATAVIAFVDPDSGRFSVATAAHPRALVRRADGSVETLEKGGLPLGVKAGEEYPTEEGVLGPGEALVLYSDGISETVGKSNRTFGVEGLCRALATGAPSAAEVVAAVSREVSVFSKGASQIDDRTIMVVRRVEERRG